MANMSAAIHEAMGFWWTGFYIEHDGMLRLGPFQGPVACYRIPHGRGVCGTAYESRETVIVPDVEQFPGHIACSSLSRSEIVVPVFAADGSGGYRKRPPLTPPVGGGQIAELISSPYRGSQRGSKKTAPGSSTTQERQPTIYE